MKYLMCLYLLQTRLERATHGLGNQITFCAQLYSVILGYT